MSGPLPQSRSSAGGTAVRAEIGNHVNVAMTADSEHGIGYVRLGALICALSALFTVVMAFAFANT